MLVRVHHNFPKPFICPASPVTESPYFYHMFEKLVLLHVGCPAFLFALR